MVSVTGVFSNTIISALCGMIIHSLWQGGLLATCVGLVLILSRNKSSAYRYNLLLASLLLFSLTALFTFIHSLVHLTSPAAIYTTGQGNTTPFITGAEPTQIMRLSFMDKALGYLNANSIFIVCIWFIVVCLRSLQLAIGIRNIFLFRNKGIVPASSYWQFRVRELSAKMGITVAIKIMESGIAKVPMVIGHLKPFILIPLGMLSNLPEAELEAILIHELAHIRRKDYLVNILQSLVEVVFFFNPAVLWVSSLIKKEREHCCDDITIAIASNKVIYIKALVSCQEYTYQQSRYGMALNGEKKHLLSRVKRLVVKDRKPITYLEKSILATCILAAALLITFFSYGGKEKNTKTTITTHTVTVVNDEETTSVTHSNNSTIKIYQPADVGNGTSMKYMGGDRDAYLLKENGVLYQLFVKGETADALYVNGKEIPVDKLPDYSAIVNKLMTLYHNGNEIMEAEEIASAPDAVQEPDTVYAKPLVSDIKACIASPVNPVITDERRLVPIDMKINDPIAIAVKAVSPVAPKEETYRSKALISDMLNDHIIIEDGSALSFKLSTKEFVVNGIKQPVSVYSKYKSKYIKPAGNSEVTWYYNYDTSSEPQK